MLLIHLQRVLVLAGLHQGIGEGRDGAQVIVDSLELAGKSASI